MGFSLVVVSKGSCSVRTSHCGGFSCCRAQALGTWASVVAAHGLRSCGSQALEHRLCSCGSRALEHRLSSYGAQVSLFHGVWDPPGSRIEPTSPALAGRFFTTDHQGSPKIVHF